DRAEPAAVGRSGQPQAVPGILVLGVPQERQTLEGCHRGEGSGAVHQILPQGSDPAMLPDAGGAVRGPQGRVSAVPGEELRRLQRDLPGPGRGGTDAGCREEEVHQDVRREAVVVGADGELLEGPDDAVLGPTPPGRGIRVHHGRGLCGRQRHGLLVLRGLHPGRVLRVDRFVPDHLRHLAKGLHSVPSADGDLHPREGVSQACGVCVALHQLPQRRLRQLRK
ncbi:unnamed protein product, partial [Ectocarpus sp. 4 AP-2014]